MQGLSSYAGYCKDCLCARATVGATLMSGLPFAWATARATFMRGLPPQQQTLIHQENHNR